MEVFPSWDDNPKFPPDGKGDKGSAESLWQARSDSAPWCGRPAVSRSRGLAGHRDGL
ncbi:hypothetical protein GCM10023192_66280 [Amycolatopsis samaneae]